LWSEPFTLALEVKTACCLEPDFVITLKPQGLGVLITPPSAAVKLPAQWLDGLGSPWNTLQLKGSLSVLSHQFELLLSTTPPQITGGVELRINQLSSRLSTVKPLGSYRVLFNSQSTPQIELSSLAESRLLLSGRGQWHNGRVQFEGLADTAPSDEETLSNLLNVLGQRSGHQAQLRME
jgi:general secretion pathway protein N